MTTTATAATADRLYFYSKSKDVKPGQRCQRNYRTSPRLQN